MKRGILFFLLLLISLLTAGCAGGLTAREKGMLVGGAGGTAGGALIGAAASSAAIGAAIGGPVASWATVSSRMIPDGRSSPGIAFTECTGQDCRVVRA